MKKINLEKILLIFVICCPILDIISFLFRQVTNLNYSPSTFIRPIIPTIAIIIIFFKNDKKTKIKLTLVGVVYFIYSLIHLYLFKEMHTTISYGNTRYELQYLINYTFMILNLIIYAIIFKDENVVKLKRYTLITMSIYIISIYLSILTNTASSTYVEGIGQKGWFESGNSTSAILILGLFILYTLVRDTKYNKIAIPVILFTGVYLMTFIGTRVGLFGFIIVSVVYVFAEIIIAIKGKFKLNKKVVIATLGVLVILVGFVIVKGSSTLERRRFLKEEQKTIVDEETNEELHVTISVNNLKKEIEQGLIPKEVMSEKNQNAIMYLCEFAEENNINSTDRRVQELVYNYYKFTNQNDIRLTLFGNGYLNNFSELILEMEIPAFLFNFGIIGLLLYFAPFFAISVYATYVGIKNIAKIDVEYIMLLAGSYFTYFISFFAGCTFFNSSTMIMIVVLNVLLLGKTREIKN